MAMNEMTGRIPFSEWARILRRNFFLIVAVSVVTFVIALVFVMRMPNVYRAETRILVNPQRISDKYVSSAVSMDSTERLNTLSQQVMSSTRLQTIMDGLHLFPTLRKRMGRDQLIERMRQHITIDLKQSSDGPSSFTLSYTGESAAEVAAVTNQLAASFIDWNLRDRASEAEGTTSFLSEELAQSKSELDKLEEQLREYKLQHLGELPDQMQANLQTLSRLQVQLQANIEAQSRLDREAILTQANTATNGMTSPAVAITPHQQLIQRAAQAHRELAELKSRYTDSFPAVVTKQEEVNALDAQVEHSPSQGTATASTTSAKAPQDPRVQLIEHDRNTLANERRQIEAGISSYQARVDSTPIREQEISQLLRDYDTAKEHYKSLLEKTYSAQMAAELEHQQEGGTFTMLDPARTPDLPIGPNRAGLLAGFAAFALALGIGAGALREIADTSVKSESSLALLLPHIPILGIVPQLTASSTKLPSGLQLRESA